MNNSDQEIFSDLNLEQKSAVECTEGPLLVLAGAGTGKTKVITTRIAYLLKRGVTPSEILALTFTRKAATEMSDRIEELLGCKPRGLTISTFHSLGLRILRELQSGVQPRVFVEKEQLELIKILGERFSLHLDQERTLFQISRAKNWGLSPEELIRTAKDERELRFGRCYRAYEETLDSRGAIDLDDMVSRPLRILQNSNEIRADYQRRWRYVLVDEYQDTNRIQYSLVRAILGKAPNICVVGDDDQSIYGFRGSEPERILSFREDFPNATAVALTINYRSHAEIISLANAIIQRAKKRLRLATTFGPLRQFNLAHLWAAVLSSAFLF